MKIIVDTREKDPILFTKHDFKKGTLKTGDYTIEGFEKEIAIERKGIGDACSTVLQGRDRFKREMERAKKFKFFAIVIEGREQDLKNHIKKITKIRNKNKRLSIKAKNIMFGKMKTVVNTYYHWSVLYNYPVFFCKNKLHARKVIVELFRAFIKYKKRKIL